MDRIYVYAKNLNDLGEKIIEINNKYLNSYPVEASIEGLRNKHNNILRAIEEYIKCKTALVNIIPPSSVRIEHENIVDAMELFIEGTKKMANSINVERCTLDKELMSNGFSMRKRGEITVTELADKISEKLNKQ